MTRDGSFKRAVRQRARDYGQRYTEALAEMRQRDAGPFAATRPVDIAAVRHGLERRIGGPIESLAPIDDDPATRPRGSWPGHYPSTLLARGSDGARWIARVYSSGADRADRVAGDAEILRFLADHGYPAERAVGDGALEVGDASVLLTEFLEGGRPTDAEGRVTSPTVFRELGGLLGRLHALPPAPGAPSRDGGSEEHDGGFHVGRPKEDLAAAMGFLVGVESELPDEARPAFELLREAIEQADDAEGLPEALTHGSFHAWAAVGVPGTLSVVGWAGSGRGPRLPSLAWLLTTAAEGPDGDASVDAVAAGYREHVTLTDEEVRRLPGVMSIRPLWLASLDFREAARRGSAPRVDEGWTLPWGLDRPERAGRIADRVAARR